MLTTATDLLGQTIAGYRLLQVLGRGGMSIVFLGQSLDDPQAQVAIKVLMPKPSMVDERPSFQTRFTREVQATHQLHHEHIVPVLSYGETTDGLPYMVMRLIPGGTLGTRLTMQQGPLPLAEIAGYMNQLASALDYAHQRGIVHRDIKPSNVLLDTQGNVYLADFGIAHLYDSGPNALDQSPTTLTGTGEMLGTPAYIAPERFVGEPATPAADIYALGVMLYLLVAGQLPFEADNPLVLGMKHLHDVPVSPRSLRPELPEPAAAALLRALAKQPADRFTSAGAMAQAFEAGLKGQWTEGLVSLPLMIPPEQNNIQAEQPQPPPLIIRTDQSDPQAAQLMPSPLVTPPYAGDTDAEPLKPPALVTPPYAGDTEVKQPVPPIPMPAYPAMPGSSQVSPLPEVRSRSRLQPFSRLLLAGTLLVVIALLAILGVQKFGMGPGSQIFSTNANGGGKVITPSTNNSNITITANNNTVTATRNNGHTVLWRFTTNGQVIPPPDVVGDTVYVATQSGYVYALRINDGKLLWSYYTRSPIVAPLVVANGIVYVYTENGTYELRASDGALLGYFQQQVTPPPAQGVTPTTQPTSGVTPTTQPTTGVTPTTQPTTGVTPTTQPTTGVTPTIQPTTGAPHR